jgi:hypothetical protein
MQNVSMAALSLSRALLFAPPSLGESLVFDHQKAYEGVAKLARFCWRNRNGTAEDQSLVSGLPAMMLTAPELTSGPVAGSDSAQATPLGA